MGSLGLPLVRTKARSSPCVVSAHAHARVSTLEVGYGP